MTVALQYQTLEKISVGQPVDRLSFIAEQCRSKIVLDIGCFDETALQKRETVHWLHGRIAAVARQVIGVDSSSAIPAEGISVAANSVIYRGDGVDVSDEFLRKAPFDIVVAGEFIEHIDAPLRFFKNMRKAFPGKELVFSTPNGSCFANTLLGSIGREVQHHDHLHVFSYKILNTLCLRAGFSEWSIIPYRFYATEMIMASKGGKKALVQGVEKSIRLVERLFPLLSFGYIVKARL